MNVSIKRGMALLLTAIIILSSLSIVEATETDLKISLLDTYPANNSIVSKEVNTITFEFTDGIIENYTDIKKMIEINSYKIAPNMPDLDSDSIDNYNVTTTGNKLILERKTDKGNLNGFSHYTVTLKEKAVRSITSIGIYNKQETITFTTNNMVKETFPQNNYELVELEPTIKFTFKYPIEILNKSLIKISSDGTEFLLDPKEINTSDNSSVLNISINDIETIGNKKYKLRPDTLYKVTLEKGAVKFKNYNIQNEEINLYFITKDSGEVPFITGYTSTQDRTFDDITSLSTTKLGCDGSIYIHFNEPIRWDKGLKPSATVVKLYKIPNPTKIQYDYSGKKINETYTYLSDGKTIITENSEKTDSVPVNSIEILDNDQSIIMIRPKEPLLSLNQYNLKLSKEFVENRKAYNIDKDIDFYFWTKPSENKQIPSWKVDKMTAEYIKEGIISPYEKKYTLYGVPQYTNIIDEKNEKNENPIILYAEGELLPKVDNDEALSKITLREVYYDYHKKEYIDSSNIGFLRYKLQYYNENTKISLYPSKTLERGKNYRLIIDKGTFETRSRDEIAGLELNFVVEGDVKEAVGIYNITPSGLSIGQIAQENQSFTIKGYNLSENIEKIELMPENDVLNKMKKVTIGPEDIRFKTVTEIKVLLRGKIAEQLSKEDSIGDYRVYVYFDNSISKKVVDSGYSYLTILPDKTPYIKDVYLTNIWDFQWLLKDGIQNNDIEYSATYNYLAIVIGHYDDNIELNENVLDKMTLTAKGTSVNLIDTSAKKPELNKGAAQPVILIPIKGLTPNTEYFLDIGKGLVYTVGNATIEETDAVNMEFKTRTYPHVDTVFAGSVTEDYDASEPILIKGDNFVDTYYDHVIVYFNDIMAQKVDIIRDTLTGEVFLKVYLPRQNRLQAGTYDITIANGDNHRTTLYAAFSVVKVGQYIPNEIEALKGKTKTGDIMSSLTVSDDTLLLNSRYSDAKSLELDLDELMGQDVLIRRIKYEADGNDILNKLEVKSIWADITLRDIRPTSNKRRNQIEIIIGRADPHTIQVLKEKLKGADIKSEFINVSGSGYSISGISLSIPYKDSNGTNLIALRYDEANRRWEEETFYIDEIENRVNIKTNNRGIFIIIGTQDFH